MIVTLVPDVLFSSKISQTAAQLKLELTACKTAEHFKETVLMSKPQLVIIDLNAKGIDPWAAVHFLQEYNMSNYGAAPPRAIGVCSHEDKPAIERGRREGLSDVLPRSKFARDLSQILSGGTNAQSGVAKLTMLVFGVIIAAALYSAYYILPFFYYYYDLVNQMEQLIRVASTNTDKEIREKLMYFITRYEIPAKPEDLKIIREGQRMKISLPYQEVFYISWAGRDYDLHTFSFVAQAEGQF